MNNRNDEARWAAVSSRDVSASGEFVYAVRTTGIYCRPGCSSRTPKRENVEFFKTPEEARAAGYRPCRRCRPDDGATGIPGNGGDAGNNRLIAAACRRIESDAAEGHEAPLENLAAGAGLSPSHFHRVFKNAVGVTPHEYAAAVRTGRLLEALENSVTVTDAVYEAGYSSPSRAYDEWKGRSALTPSEHRRGAPGRAIAYAVAPCRLGWALVGVTAGGLCAAMFADAPEELPGLLEKRFPKAEISEIGAAESGLIREALAGLDGTDARHDLPLDIQGTVFQKRVWKALRDIPAGETATYGEVARRIGAPDSARAVANACAANSIACLVPCHRVIRNDGTIGGYRWGAERKKELLERERTGAQRAPR